MQSKFQLWSGLVRDSLIYWLGTEMSCGISTKQLKQAALALF